MTSGSGDDTTPPLHPDVEAIVERHRVESRLARADLLAALGRITGWFSVAVLVLGVAAFMLARSAGGDTGSETVLLVAGVLATASAVGSWSLSTEARAVRAVSACTARD